MNKIIITSEIQKQLDNDIKFICDDCGELCDIEDGANFKTRSSGTLTLCHECGSEFDHNSRCAIGDGVADDYNHDQYGFYPEDRHYQSDIPDMADYGDRD